MLHWSVGSELGTSVQGIDGPFSERIEAHGQNDQKTLDFKIFREYVIFLFGLNNVSIVCKYYILHLVADEDIIYC